jgi:predicted anti-sigma-YlaC factor YlaD
MKETKLRHMPVVGAGQVQFVLSTILTIMPLLACSPKQMAANLLADTLAGGGGVFASDPDPDLVREALPFGLKTYEGLLQSTPQHRGLLTATAKGFTAYAYMLKEEGDRVEDRERARAQRLRAKGLFLRGRDYALHGLEVAHPGFTAGLGNPAQDVLGATTVDDAALLYWAGAAWAGAISTDKQDFMLLADLDITGQLVERVIELDDDFDRGAAHQFLVTYEGGRPAGNRELARQYYGRALALSGGGHAGLHLALAEAVAVRERNAVEFRRLLDAALAVDLDAHPDWRVANVIAQRRARWLKAQIPELFFEASDNAASAGGS